MVALQVVPVQVARFGEPKTVIVEELEITELAAL